MNMFAWNPIELLGISQEVVEHTLNIKPSSKPVRQGLRYFNQEKRRAMGEELSRLFPLASLRRSNTQTG
jgi:hypothetical protein